jgi:hypothetical protein
LLWVRGIGDALLSSEDLRAAPLSLSVTRDEAELEDEFELFMQFSSTDGSALVYRNLGSASRIMKRMEMTDPKVFLAKSGWYPGIQLQ